MEILGPLQSPNFPTFYAKFSDIFGLVDNIRLVQYVTPRIHARYTYVIYFSSENQTGHFHGDGRQHRDVGDEHDCGDGTVAGQERVPACVRWRHRARHV